ncbi:tetratricopeptide repeat protein [Maribellus sp. YY47]|uniref:tetratricopeptide repeat protein n=1 Tax=Maribellus sp. YY47 TaxID=2929486 RepID=UPI002001D777|nr:tetratricopeptide repeat protein [Maribellus sp. YY47]MCK3686062.1 tetratricopeptide repeat protein [Maribellus sp. YY47]
MTHPFKCLLLSLLMLPFLSEAQHSIDQLIISKNYPRALAEINKQLEKSPSAELYLKKGVVFQNLQDYQQAVAAFSEGLMYEPENVTMLGETAESFAILGNNQDAVSFYKKAVSLAPNDLVLAGKLGRVYINLKDHKNAYDVFSSIYARDSSNVFWNKQLAYCAFKAARREEAIHLYEKVLFANPRDYTSYLNLINCYSTGKDGNRIMAVIERGLAQFPADPDLLLEKAMFFYATKRYGPAMIAFEKYKEVEEQVPYDVEMNYGIATYFAGFEDKALEIFNKLNQVNPNDALVIYYQSLCYKKMKDFEQAGKLMQWAIDASTPDYVAEMYHHLGQIFGQQRMFKESIDALNKALELNPGKVEVLFEIATTYEEFNSNKTLAMNYYNIYIKEAGEAGKNISYALDRIEKLKEDLFFDE